jgi:hypothetical protein
MTNELVLTYAEVGFLLTTQPELTGGVRAQLNLPDDADERDARAGVASLLVRGLCSLNDSEVRPGDQLIAVIAALTTSTVRVSAVGWSGPTISMLHIFGGPNASVALVPEAYGRFVVTLVDPTAPIEILAVRMLDALVGEPESGLVVRMVRDRSTSGVAIAVDGQGTWFTADADASPDHGVPATREQAVQRLTDLLGATLIGGVA